MAVGTICPDELRGYTLDQRARWMFLLRYAPYSFTAIVLGWLVIQYATTDSTPIWVSSCGLLAAFALHGFGMVRYFNGTPVSRVTGLPMQRYKVVPSKPTAIDDRVFICHVSKTYFRLTWYGGD